MTEKPEDLPDLTPKQFAFVKGILEGKTASDAYRAAYDAGNMADEVIWVKASELRSSGKVSVWLSRARSEALTTAVMTKEAYLQELLNDRIECKVSGNHGAAVKALELAGKVMGHYVDKHEDVGRPALADVLARIETKNPELARLLADRLGLDKDEKPVSH